MLLRRNARVLLLLGALCHAQAFAAAPTFDESPGGATNSAVTTHTVTAFASVTAGSFKIIASREGGTSNLLDTCAATTDGNMPLITDGTDTATVVTATRTLEVFGITNSTSGAVGQNCTSSSATTTDILGAVYNGVHTTVPYGNVVIGTFTATTTPSIAITTTWTDALVLCVILTNTSGTTIVPGDTETSRQTWNLRLNLEDIDATTPGAFTCNWTLGTSGGGGMVAVELKSTTSTLPGGLLLRRIRN